MRAHRGELKVLWERLAGKTICGIDAMSDCLDYTLYFTDGTELSIGISAHFQHGRHIEQMDSIQLLVSPEVRRG